MQGMSKQQMLTFLETNRCIVTVEGEDEDEEEEEGDEEEHSPPKKQLALALVNMRKAASNACMEALLTNLCTL